MRQVSPVVLLSVLAACADSLPPPETGSRDLACLREHVWVWGSPDVVSRTTNIERPSPTSFAASSPVERARVLGTSRIIMAGNGIPAALGDAMKQTLAASGASRLVWEIAPDSGEGAPFIYSRRLEVVAAVADSFPGKIQGVMLDDLTSRALDAGLEPREVAAIRPALIRGRESLELWGVAYLGNLGRPGLQAYLEPLDVVSLWAWRSEEIPALRDGVEALRRLVPGKQYVLGLYLYDFASDRKIPAALIDQQLALAKELLEAHRIRDVILLTIVEAPEEVARAAHWVEALSHGSGCATPD